MTFEDSMKVMKKIENKKIFSSSGIVSILLIIAFSVTIASMTDGVVFFIFMLLFLGAVMGSGAWFIHRSNTRHQQKNYETECVDRVGTLSSDKIILKFDKTKSEIDWDLFEKVIKVESSLVIVKGSNFLGFAEYMFETQSDWQRAKELICNKYVLQSYCT